MTVGSAGAVTPKVDPSEPVEPHTDDDAADREHAKQALQPWPTGRHKRPRATDPEPAPPTPTAIPRPPAPRPAPPPIDPTAPRPTVVDDTVILGLSRLSRGKLGSRLFTLFFVFVYGLILVQLVASLLNP